MTATTYMFHPQTRTRLFAIPCVSIEMARMVAIGQTDTLNIVFSQTLMAVYENRALIFFTRNATAAHAWMRQRGLSLHSVSKPEPHPRKSPPKSQGSRANMPNGFHDKPQPLTEPKI